MDDFTALSRYRRAADYLAAAMIHLRSNVLLHQPLRPEHVKPRLLGHWGTCPGITFVYAGLNRLIRDTGQRTLLVTGPGHGAPANHANLWLEGTHGDLDPTLTRDAAGLDELVRRFSWPGGFPSHLSPQVPGVVHEGGELGYALATAFGAAFDDPGLLVACIVGDGEAETGPTAGAWHSSKYLDPATSGAVLPILHLNGYKIASPTVYGSMSDAELTDYFSGLGWQPEILDVTTGRAAEEPDAALAEVLDRAHRRIRRLQREHRNGPGADRGSGPRWPVLVVRSPKGWGVPSHDAHGEPLESTFHAHQVPLEGVADDEESLRLLESWLRSYRPEELFAADGRPAADVLAVAPDGELRMGAVPQANGGVLRRDLPLPALEPYAVAVDAPGTTEAGPTPVLGEWLAQLFRNTEDRRDFRVVCPDELESNKLQAVLQATSRAYVWPLQQPSAQYSEHLAPAGRVLETLSEHNCQGWLQGYLLTGRHGLFPCYEAFVSIVDGMVNQYAKFLKMSGEVDWRAPVASLNYLLTSEGWRQEHNGYSHQGPGFINQVLQKKSSVARVYLPPDANTLLVTMEHVLASTNRINVVVAGKQDSAQWLSLEQARAHCADGGGVWAWAGHGDEPDRNPERDPDVVLACAGGVPTVETLAAAWLLRRAAPDLHVRVVNVVDLLALAPRDRHPHGVEEERFTAWFGRSCPVVFDFHGYPSAVHEVLHGRRDPARFHVHGYLEEGTTTTPYELLASNRAGRHDLAAAAVRHAAAAGWRGPAAQLVESLEVERERLRAQLRREGNDPQEITDWSWS